MAVPGELRGKLPWVTLFEPAIQLAFKGFEVTESLHIAVHKWKKEVEEEKCLRYVNMNQY